jgi:hypothetical protein
MREFFRGWKRKVGVGTLVLTCALVRSCQVSYTHFSDAEEPPEPVMIFGFEIHPFFGVVEICVDRWVEARKIMLPTPILTIPFSFMVVPLALLSAYLLLSQPRGVTKPAPIEPTEPDHA